MPGLSAPKLRWHVTLGILGSVAAWPQQDGEPASCLDAALLRTAAGGHSTAAPPAPASSLQPFPGRSSRLRPPPAILHGSGRPERAPVWVCAPLWASGLTCLQPTCLQPTCLQPTCLQLICLQPPTAARLHLSKSIAACAHLPWLAVCGCSTLHSHCASCRARLGVSQMRTLSRPRRHCRCACCCRRRCCWRRCCRYQWPASKRATCIPLRPFTAARLGSSRCCRGSRACWPWPRTSRRSSRAPARGAAACRAWPERPSCVRARVAGGDGESDQAGLSVGRAAALRARLPGRRRRRAAHSAHRFLASWRLRVPRDMCHV